MHPSLVKDQSAVFHSLSLVKWLIHLIKSRAKVSNQVWLSLFTLFKKLTTSMDGSMAAEMLPQVSSVATRIITDDIKHSHTQKI